jgi:hypothetical protein
MPINYQQIQSQVQEFSRSLAQLQVEISNKKGKATALLQEYASQGEMLQAKVARAAALNGSLRCAVPAGEALDAHFPLPPMPSQAALLAADGSQINPSRHSQLDYAMVNIGVVQMLVGSAAAPTTTIRSDLLRIEKLYTPNGVISEGAVALLRDLGERRLLAEMARQQPPPVFTLTDGPLELYREPQETRDFEKSLEQYLEVLGQLAAAGAATAGVVDKPRSDLVVRLLEVALLKDSDLQQAGKARPLLGLTDTKLFEDLLATPGDRSAVFAIQSESAQKFTGHLALHFFFINVGRPKRSWLMRVEIPAWVAHNPTMLDGLHAVLLAQSQILGNQPFPYLLHRAHEVAVVTLEDQAQLEQMISMEITRQKGTLGEKSHKQSEKDLSGRKKHNL